MSEEDTAWFRSENKNNRCKLSESGWPPLVTHYVIYASKCFVSLWVYYVFGVWVIELGGGIVVAKLKIHIFTLGMTKMDKIRNENIGGTVQIS